MNTHRLMPLSFMLACLTVSGTVMSACGSDTKPEQTPASSAVQQTETRITENVETEPTILCELPDTDWGGREYHILGRENPTYSSFNNFEICADEETGDPVNDAVFRRNSKLEEQYNVKITQELIDDTTAPIKKTVNAGDDVYQLAFVIQDAIGSLAEHGLFYDLYDVKYLDFEKPWWDQGVNDAAELCGRLFYSTSDFSLVDKARTWVLYYNPKIAEQNNIPDFVETVRDGKWTIDLMNSYVRDVANDVNGDGKMDEADTYGLVMGSYNAFATFVMAQENRIAEKTEDGSLQITMNNQHMIDSIDKALALTCDINTAFFCNDYAGKTSGDFWAAASDAFRQERALFVAMITSSLKSYSASCDFDFGAIPFPKYDEAQEYYYSISDPFGLMFAIPRSNADPDFAGFMLEALSYASTDTTLKAYYDICCKTKYAYNPDTGEMLDLIFSHIVYDPAFLFQMGNLNEILLNEIAGQKQNVFSSLYAKREKAALKGIERLMDRISAIE